MSQMRLGCPLAEAVAAAATPLPGSRPYLNRRPLAIPGRLDGRLLGEALAALHPQHDRAYWLPAAGEARLLRRNKPIGLHDVVRGGDVVVHLMPETVEPDVNAAIALLHEDEALLVVDKPAPLPVHPCGRFNRNTLTHLLSLAMPDCRLRPAHRLDAAATGIQVLTKTAPDARFVQQQFERRQIRKTYLVEVQGLAPPGPFSSKLGVARHPTTAGMRRPGRLSATTHFEVVRRGAGRSLLRAHTLSGRTHQIRLHLTELGLPLVGDRAYAAAEHRSTPCGAADRTAEAPLLGTAIHLHATTLELKHPRSRKPLRIEARPPTWLA